MKATTTATTTTRTNNTNPTTTETTTMTVREMRAARLNSTAAITTSITDLKAEVSELFDKADAIETAVSDRAAKTRITKIEKEFVVFEDNLNRLENRIETNGGVFPEFEGVKSDFETVKAKVKAEKDFLNPEPKAEVVAEVETEDTEKTEESTETTAIEVETTTTEVENETITVSEAKAAYDTAKANFLNCEGNHSEIMRLKGIKDEAFQTFKQLRSW